jgi:p38 MAP kinase
MEHPYLAQYHDPDDEPTSEPLDLDFEGDLSIDQWRRMIWKQINDFQIAKHHMVVGVDNHRMDTTTTSVS